MRFPGKKLTLAAVLLICMWFFSACGNAAEAPGRGEWQENIFISEYLQLRLALPGDGRWRVYSDAEKAALSPEDSPVTHDFFVQNVQTASTIALTFEETERGFDLHSHLEACASREAEKFAAHGLSTRHSIIGTTPLAGIEWLTKRTEIYSGESGVIALQIHLSSEENGWLRCLNFLVDDDAEFMEITAWFSWYR